MSTALSVSCTLHADQIEVLARLIDAYKIRKSAALRILVAAGCEQVANLDLISAKESYLVGRRSLLEVDQAAATWFYRECERLKWDIEEIDKVPERLREILNIPSIHARMNATKKMMEK